MTTTDGLPPARWSPGDRVLLGGGPWTVSWASDDVAQLERSTGSDRMGTEYAVVLPSSLMPAPPDDPEGTCGDDFDRTAVPLTARLGWRNPEDDPAVQLRLYATDVDTNGRWTRGPDGRFRGGRTIEHALIDRYQDGHWGEGAGREGDRYVVLTAAQYADLLARAEHTDLRQHAEGGAR